MGMKRILYIAMICLTAAGFAACTDEEEERITSQKDKMVTFLEKTLKLKTYQEAMDSSADENTPFYTVHGEWVFRWITNYYDAGRHELPQVQQGSVVGLTLSIYSYTGSQITDTTLPLFTNNEELRDRLLSSGLNLEYWSFEPYYVAVGAGNTISGLELALDGCRLYDQVEVYMAFSEAYGGEWLLTVAPESGLVVFYTIESVQ